MAIFDFHGTTNNTTILNIEKKLENIDNAFISLLKYQNQKNQNENENENELGFNSFFSYRLADILDGINKNLVEEKFYVSQNSKDYKLFYMILKSKLFIMNLKKDNHFYKIVVEKILQIFYGFFKNSQNFNVHQEIMKLLIHYLSLNNNECFDIIFYSEEILKSFINVIYVIFSPYADVEIDKFKFVDILKDQKELDKKKMKSPRTILTDIREKIMLFMLNIFNNFKEFNLVSEENKKEENKNNIKRILNNFLVLFDKNTFNEFSHEHEKNRKIFMDLLTKLMLKFFTFNKITLGVNKDNNSDNNKDKGRMLSEGRKEKDFPNEENSNFEKIKKFVNEFETYFEENTYDSVVEVRISCLTIMNIILNCFNKSEYYDVFVETFAKPESFEIIKCLAYLDDENKKINSFFKDFKKIFGILMNLYIDERITFSTQCESAFKAILEKFPIFTFDELLKAKNKNKIARLEALDKIFKKYCKPR